MNVCGRKNKAARTRDDERRALSDAQVGLTATAVKVIREQVAARAARKDALAAEKRTAGTTDPSKLTAELFCARS